MYTVLLVWFQKTSIGEVCNKSANVRVFRTEKEAKEELNELYAAFHSDGDKGYKFMKEFRIISERSNGGVSCWYGRVDFVSAELSN